MAKFCFFSVLSILGSDGDFTINQLTGLISVIKTPDREEQDRYRLVLQVIT